MRPHHLIGAALVAALLAPAPVAAETLLGASAAATLNWSNLSDGGSTTAAPAQAGNTVFLDLRPMLTVGHSSPRLVFNTNYLFAGKLFQLVSTRLGQTTTEYSNRLDVSLAAQTSSRTTLFVTAGASQGGSNFQLTQASPDMAQPTLLPPTVPATIVGNFGQTLMWDAGPRLRVSQGLTGVLSAPICDLERRTYSVNALAEMDYRWRADALGGTLRAGHSELVPLLGCGNPSPPVGTTNEAAMLLLRWRHDFGPRWSLLVAGGVTATLLLDGPFPLSIEPTGNATLTYDASPLLFSLNFIRSTGANVQTGTLVTSDTVTLRAATSLGRVLPVLLSGSIGYSDFEPVAGDPRGGLGLGSAARGDIGIMLPIREEAVFTARYTGLLQIPDAAGATTQMSHIVTIGIMARYATTKRVTAVPSPSSRVDGAGAVGFPAARSAPATPN